MRCFFCECPFADGDPPLIERLPSGNELILHRTCAPIFGRALLVDAEGARTFGARSDA